MKCHSHTSIPLHMVDLRLFLSAASASGLFVGVEHYMFVSSRLVQRSRVFENVLFFSITKMSNLGLLNGILLPVGNNNFVNYFAMNNKLFHNFLLEAFVLIVTGMLNVTEL